METLGRAMSDHTSGPASMLSARIRAITTVPHLDACLGQKTYSEIQICALRRRKLLTYDHLYVHVQFLFNM